MNHSNSNQAESSFEFNKESRTLSNIHNNNDDELKIKISDSELEKGKNESLEEQNNDTNSLQRFENHSVFKSLGFLDRFLYIWIFLAMAVGIILGNFVPNISHSLEKGQFVSVSIPIGEALTLYFFLYIHLI